jgi:G-protein coupled receptor 98
MKASYTVEMNGHPGPSTAFFTPGSGIPPAGEINKSTQNLINAMEEVCYLPSLCFSSLAF